MGAQTKSQGPSETELRPRGSPDESPVHEGKLKTYQIGRYPVTVEEYRRFMEETATRTSSGGRREASVHGPSRMSGTNNTRTGRWSMSRGMRRRRGALGGRAVADGSRMGTGGARYGGAEVPVGKRRAGHQPGKLRRDESRPRDAGGTVPARDDAGRAPRHGGEVWEWVADWYGEDYYQKSPRENPPGPKDGTSSFGLVDRSLNLRAADRKGSLQWHVSLRRGSSLILLARSDARSSAR